MAKNFSMADAVQLVEDYQADPGNKELQMAVQDVTRRYPLPMVLIASGMLPVLVKGLPRYMSLRKSVDGITSFDKSEYLGYLRSNAPSKDDEDDDSNDETDEVPEEKPKSIAKTSKKKVTVPAEVDIDSLLESE